MHQPNQPQQQETQSELTVDNKSLELQADNNCCNIGFSFRKNLQQSLCAETLHDKYTIWFLEKNNDFNSAIIVVII